MRTYLDHNATSPLRPEARDAMVGALDVFGNPSSVHAEGRHARAAVERARAQVAALAGCAPGEVVFTSGASEANATVMLGGWDLIAVSAMEHESVLRSAHQATYRTGTGHVSEIPPYMDGQVDGGHFELMRDAQARIRSEFANPLVSVQAANGETGVVQPLRRIVEVARAQGYCVHTDAVQAAGRIEVDFAAWDVDFMSLSAHKIGGPKGMGALIVRDGLELPPLVHGGGQESSRRAGTENVAAIVGFGAAAEAAKRDLADMERIAALRDRMEAAAYDMSPSVALFSATPARLANTSAISLIGAKAETLVIAFDLAGIAVSAGSACSSGKASPSHVLRAIPVPDQLTDGTFRVSLGWNTTEEDVDAFLAAFGAIVERHDRRKAAGAARTG